MLKRILLAAALPATLSASFAQPVDEAAGREHLFPLIANGEGFQSRLFVTNVSDAANQCTLALRGPGLDTGIFQANAAVAASGANATIDLAGIGAGAGSGSDATLTSTGAGALSFGYARLDCAEPAVARMLLTLENGGVPLAMATLESASPGVSFQFPALPRFGDLAMVFSNDSALDASCAAELEDAAGASIGGGNIAVPAQSTTLRFLSELATVPGDLEAGTVGLSCDRPVAALALPLSGIVFTAVPPVALDDAAAESSHIVPLIQDGGGFRSHVLLTNLADASNQCSMEPRGAGLNTTRFDLPSSASDAAWGILLTLAAKGDQAVLPSTGAGSLSFGYAAVECEGPVAVQNLVSVDAGGGPAALAVTSGASPANEFRFPVVPELGQLALYLSNVADAAASCIVELPLGGDAANPTGTVEILRRSTALRYLDDLLAVPVDFTGGMAELNCDGDIASVSLLISDPAFAALPPTVFSAQEPPANAMTVPDANLRAAVNRALGRNPGDPVGKFELAGLRALDAPNAGIESLEGLQYATELTLIDLSGTWDSTARKWNNSNSVSDLSPILELKNLSHLNLWDNKLTGSIPPELSMLSNLELLELSLNPLSGSIPPELGKLGNLSYLGIQSTGISGSIPGELGQLSNLRDLRLSNNQLTGAIPPELGELHNLIRLYLNGNALSGSIPPELGNLINLIQLLLGGNGLNGNIPPELGQLSALEDLSLGRNELSGPIPPELSQLSYLQFLDLSHNRLSGSIPDSFLQLKILDSFHIGGNEDLRGPADSIFQDWLCGVYSHDVTKNAEDECDPPPDREILETFYDATDGPNWSNNNNWLTDAPLEDWHGIQVRFGRVSRIYLTNNRLKGRIPRELGGLTRLRNLSLAGNELSGPIPPELGRLSLLTWLDLSNNELSGTLPESLVQLGKLRGFHFRDNEGLCVSGASGATAFAAWLNGIGNRDGSAAFCNESDRKALEHLFRLTGGAGWTNAQGWLDDGLVLEEWHGVRTDSLGRVTALDLERNGLSGIFSSALGSLTRMTELNVGGNPDLHGRLPLSLAELPIEALHYSGTGVCAPANTFFRDWLDAVPSHEGTGGECGRTPSSDREILEILYDATDGPNWTNSGNWFTDAPLGDWHGVEVDQQGRVIKILLIANQLKGRIPREIGGLAHLQILSFYGNHLTGPIPADLANLYNLRDLILSDNNLTGPIPPELGGLVNLELLQLDSNDLTGPIPSEIGNLTDLWLLKLSSNDLTGHIPPELGDLVELGVLSLGLNGLTGRIPPELGNLVKLRNLTLSGNALTGQIPPEIGGLINLVYLRLGKNQLTGSLPSSLSGLTRLRTLSLQANAGLSGTLPADLANLAAFETLLAEGTGLCAPSDAGFLEWFKRVPVRRVAFCEGGGHAKAYLVQAVQSREFPVPLVAGEEALLRVFVTADRENSESLPPARASFYRNGALVHTADIPAGPGAIPTEVDEGSLGTSVNAVIPADVIQPGLEMVVEVDPDGTLDAALGVAGRIPAAGRMAVDVREVPVLDLTLVPFLWTKDGDSAVLDAARGMAADPDGHELLDQLRQLLPVNDLAVTAHEPVLSSSNNAYDLFEETWAIRVMEGGTGYYMGMMSGDVTGAGGLGGGVASFAVPGAGVIAHEFGHNFGLPHAPCPAHINTPDFDYPYADGTIGAWGYDFQAGGLVPPTRYDLMSYCGPKWISDYNFAKALHFRIETEEERNGQTSPVADAARSLLLWGSADFAGAPHLNTAFVVDAPPALPDAAGAYRITGRTAAGDRLFAFSFAMPETFDGDGSSSFAFALPVEPDWSGALASITLTGPGGSTTLDAVSDQPMAILRNPQTGRVRGILRDPRFATEVATAGSAAGLSLEASVGTGGSPAPAAGGAAAGQSLEILFSRGIPDAEAWQR